MGCAFPYSLFSALKKIFDQIFQYFLLVYNEVGRLEFSLIRGYNLCKGMILRRVWGPSYYYTRNPYRVKQRIILKSITTLLTICIVFTLSSPVIGSSL